MQRHSNLDEIEKKLVQSLKIMYMTGKGQNNLVPVLIPPDTTPALAKLANTEVRRDASVLPENQFLFASTRSSEGHTSGWHAIHSVIDKLNLKKTRKFQSHH